MAKHAKTLRIIADAQAVLAAHSPMTLRQVFYQLVSRQVIENSEGRYKALSKALVQARRDGAIPWEWIEDRQRQPRRVSMWRGLADFAEMAKRAYRRNVWESQPAYVECWLEKDALSGIFEDILHRYGVTLCVGRGFDGWDSIHNAAVRYGGGQGVTVLYFGDFDPSGEDMVRSLRERLESFDCKPEIVKCALTREDIARYNLPPNPTKLTDTRRPAFVAKHGDMAVELDALPLEVLQERIRHELEARLDMEALRAVRATEREERDRLEELLTDAA